MDHNTFFFIQKRDLFTSFNSDKMVVFLNNNCHSEIWFYHFSQERLKIDTGRDKSVGKTAIFRQFCDFEAHKFRIKAATSIVKHSIF